MSKYASSPPPSTSVPTKKTTRFIIPTREDTGFRSSAVSLPHPLLSRPAPPNSASTITRRRFSGNNYISAAPAPAPSRPFPSSGLSSTSVIPTMSAHDKWSSPLDSRYASDKMKRLFSPRTRIEYWRHCWLWLAESQQALGVKEITDEALQQMRNHLVPTDEEFEIARIEEAKAKHDVIGHIRAYVHACPAAAGIVHLGATSCYVTDNGDLLTLRHGLSLILPKLAQVIQQFSSFALEHADLPTLSFTHLQPAQVTTVGKRFCLYIADLLDDLHNIEQAQERLRFRGAKGTTGTQASYLTIFNGDESKVEQLDKMVTEKAGFKAAYPITGQTYSRKVDVNVISALAGFGATCEKIGLDIRHLASIKEIEEGFDDKNQVGSSAMAYKRNPMKSERLCALSRSLKNLVNDALNTFGAQIFERTLDDSANRRLTLPHAFLLADACIRLLDNISRGLTVYPAIIQRNLNQELPFMATENIIMRIVAHGGSRQEAHEVIRTLSHETTVAIKLHGKHNDLIDRIRPNPYFRSIVETGELDKCLDPKTFYGRAPSQVKEFLGEGGECSLALKKYHDSLTNGETMQEITV